jgi:hypothetical protein
MSAQSTLAKKFPELQGQWNLLTQVFGETPTSHTHWSFDVKESSNVNVGDLILLPTPAAVPGNLPGADKIGGMEVLWCKIEGKIECAQQQQAAQGAQAVQPPNPYDVMVQAVAGKESAFATQNPLPMAFGFTLKSMRTLFIPTALFVSAQQLDAPTQQSQEATPTTGNQFLSNCASTFKVANLDKNWFECNSKKDYIERMTQLHTLTRLFSKERADKYLNNLVFKHELMYSNCTNIVNTHMHLPITHVDFGLSQYASTKDMGVMADGFGPDSRFQAALLFKFNATNHKEISILDFLEPSVPGTLKFEKSAITRNVRVQLKQAMENLQMFLCAFSDKAFSVALEPIISMITSNDVTFWSDFEDAFLLYRVSTLSCCLSADYRARASLSEGLHPVRHCLSWYSRWCRSADTLPRAAVHGKHAGVHERLDALSARQVLQTRLHVLDLLVPSQAVSQAQAGGRGGQRRRQTASQEGGGG